jgi:chemotaxis protein MotB
LSDNLPVQEIVIVRRGHGNHDEGHHGGMWKIAFADFMTAMMAFFLVMWLISASDEKTLDQIATYFNPIKLPDAQKSEKTLQTQGDAGAPDTPDEHKAAEAKKKDPKNKGIEAEQEKEHQDSKEGKQKVADEALFADPYGVLSKLATQVVRVPLPTQGVRKDDATSFSGGAAFRDPFDPDFRRRAPDAPENPAPAEAAAQQAAHAKSANEDAPDEGGAEPLPQPAAQASAPPMPERQRTPVATEPAQAKQAKTDPGAMGLNPTADAGAGDDAAAARAAANNLTGDASKPGQDGAKASTVSADGDAAARQLAADIREAMSEADLSDLPDITVQRKPEGILISLTDKLNFEMFGSSSATPRPELVVAMEKIGKLLQTRPERVVVRGHTDSRPFRTGNYDNWRLSTDRAHITHYMLVRGGLPEKRFERVEGYADRELKVPGDPKAAANRRIEILLRQPMS